MERWSICAIITGKQVDDLVLIRLSLTWEVCHSAGTDALWRAIKTVPAQNNETQALMLIVLADSSISKVYTRCSYDIFCRK